MRYLLFTLIFLASVSFSTHPASKEKTGAPGGKAKNIVLLIGDGMGLSQISAALFNQSKPIVLEEFPVIGFQKTQSEDNLITDSAASATAIATGKKTTNTSIGVDPEENPLKSILEEAEEQGLATGLVATSSIVHATPGSFIAHSTSRNFYEEIALAFLDTEIDLFIGGGKRYFDRRTKDDRNLIAELKEKDYLVYDYFNDEIHTAQPDPKRNYAYFTADNQPVSAFQGRDYLPFATEKALGFLNKRSEQGFFIMIEGSQIDWSGHANQAAPLLAEIKDFNKAVRRALDFAKADGETLVIVTADHETGGLAINPGSKVKNLNLAFTTNGHTATMVPVFAYGPQAETFGGIYENTEIYYKMKSALGF